MESTVYLEDVDSPRKIEKQDGSSEEKSPSATATAVVKSGTSGSEKRQRTLMDMFSGSQSKNTEAPSAKKLRLSVQGPNHSSLSASGTDTGSSSNFKGFGVQKLNSISFSLSAFQETLTDEQKNLLRLECEVIGKSWLKVLRSEIKKPYFIALKKFLWDEGIRGADDSLRGLKIYPAPRNIYSWSNTPLGKVKVVIIGQDPYHGKGQAHGLCFSVPKGVAIPPSLKNIYAEIKGEYPDFEPPEHGNLTAWANNGVLMLNTCLTVRAGEPGSHSNKGWEEFTDRVVDVVDKYGGANLATAGDVSDRPGIGRGVVFLAWGSWAAKRVAKLNKGKHLILTSAHPSPFSAHRGFLGNGHFKAANEWLEHKYGAEGRVDWCNLDTEN